MKMKPKPKPKPAWNICEVCEEPTTEDYLSGCQNCARLFAPCCNSEDPDLCVECV